MRKAIIVMVLTLAFAMVTVVPAFASPGDGNNGCHFGRGHENPWFDGKSWGEANSNFAQSEPGARADQIGQREGCRD